MAITLIETVEGNVYDHPRYYDLVFGSDWKAEFDFLLACFNEHADRRVTRVFEPACGTGRLLFRLGKAGYRVSGLDLNPHAVQYCNRRLVRHGLPSTTSVGDMTDFRLHRPADAAFNMINSFRHLPTERSARAHLECMSAALSRGGIYLLGMHLTPTACAPTEEEAWSARRGHLCVNTRMWLLERDLANRAERYAMTYDVLTPTRSLRIADSFVFRTYTRADLRRLLRRVPELELAAVYDFRYDIREPIEIDDSTEDVVLVLKKT